MLKPVQGDITSNLGNRTHPVTGVYTLHNGVDYGAPSGAEIISPESGTVESVYYNAAGGNQVVINHGLGMRTGYAHLSAVNVQKGDKVKTGDVIGNVGATGAVTGPHLHFTLKQGEKYLDPVKHTNGLQDWQLLLITGIIILTGIYLFNK